MEGYSTNVPHYSRNYFSRNRYGATFQEIGTALRQSQFVFRISKSIVRAEGFK